MVPRSRSNILTTGIIRKHAAALAVSGAVWAALGPEQSGAAALNVVLAEPGISIRGLSHVLGLSHSATVRVADRLQREGLITRDWAGPGRTLAVKVTGRGRQRAVGAAARRTQVLQQATSGLTAAQRESLTGLLQKVVLSLADDQAAGTEDGKVPGDGGPARLELVGDLA